MANGPFLRAQTPLSAIRSIRTLVGVAGTITLAACTADAGVLEPQEAVSPFDLDVATVTLSPVIGLSLNPHLLTVLGSTSEMRAAAWSSGGELICTEWASAACPPSVLNNPLRFKWTTDVPGALSLEQFDTGSYPVGGVYFTALAEGRVAVTASVEGLEGTTVIEVDERARVEWSLPSRGHPISAEAGIAIGEDGTIYLSTNEGLQAVEAQGNVRWSLPARLATSPAIDEDGRIYLGSKDGLIAVDHAGNVLWSTPIKGSSKSAPAIGPNGTIYVVGLGGTLFAVDPTGKIAWMSAVPASAPAIGLDGTIYFGSVDRHLYALNPDGSERWRFGTGGPVRSPSIGADGTIYFANDRVEAPGSFTRLSDARMYALNPDGTERWSAGVEGGVHAAPAIGVDGSVYLGTTNTEGRIYVFASDGSLLRRLRPGSSGTPIVAGDGSIYLGTFGHFVYALNADGTLKWEYGMKGSSGLAPAIGLDGAVYAGSHDGARYKIQAFSELGANNGGYYRAPWPQSRGDRANTGRARAVGALTGP